MQHITGLAATVITTSGSGARSCTRDEESVADWHKGCKVHLGLTCSVCLGTPSVNDDRLAEQNVGTL
jgi:hypothetical protein